MPNLGSLTEADIRQWLDRSVNPGLRYVKRVQNPMRIGETLSAQVMGGYLYQVEVTVKASGINSRCTCSWGGNCKHVAAVLLKWVQSPSSFGMASEPASVREHDLEVIPIEPPQTHRPQDLPWWIRLPFDERRQAERQQLQQWLTQAPLQDLRALAKNLGWPIKGNNKQVIAGQVAQEMSSPDNILRALRSLDADHQRALYAMVAGYGHAIRPEDIERIAAVWGGLPRRLQAGSCMVRLRDVGLAVYGHSTAYRSEYLVPNAVARHVVPELDTLVRSSQSQPGMAAVPQLADPYAFVQVIHQVMQSLEQLPVTLRPPMPRPQIERSYPALQAWDYDPEQVAGLVAGRQLQTHGYLNLRLTVPPPRALLPDQAVERLAPLAGGAARLEFIYALLVASGLFQPGSPVTVWPEVKEQFLRLDEMGQRAVLASSYMTMPSWSELWDVLRANNLTLKRVAGYGDHKPAHVQNDLANFRVAMLRVLACLPDDQWIALDDVFRALRAILPRLDGGVWSVYGPANPPWYLTKAGSDKALDMRDAGDFDLVQGNFIRQIITGPLHWLGLVDLGIRPRVQDPGDLVACRLHGLGDLFWDREAVPAPPQVAAPAEAARDASQGPAGQALAAEGLAIAINPAALKAQAHGLLERIARLDAVVPNAVVSGAAKTGHLRYRLDAQAVHRTFEAGAALADILSDWERLLPVAMPEAIRSQLTRWWEAYGRVRVYENLAVIEFGDDYALAEIRAATGLGQHLVAEISPRLVVINKEALPVLMAELEKAGYTPKQTSDV